MYEKLFDVHPHVQVAFLAVGTPPIPRRSSFLLSRVRIMTTGPTHRPAQARLQGRLRHRSTCTLTLSLE